MAGSPYPDYSAPPHGAFFLSEKRRAVGGPLRGRHEMLDNSDSQYWQDRVEQAIPDFWRANRPGGARHSERRRPSNRGARFSQ
jgi:hypothetical protein